ncbi:MAG: cytochrome c biogenesis CcdA family protein [Ilumatobacteraceae bacterium]
MSLSFLRGLVAAVNPCAFVLLPTYLMYFLGMQGQLPGTQRATVRRALVVSGSLSTGFMSVFVVAGLISYHFTSWINQNAKYATAVIAVGLVGLGVAMLLGYKLPISTPRLDVGGRTRGLGSMYLFGVAYAVASIGCTIGLFLATLLGARRDGIASGVANVVAYGVGMALLVTALTVALAVANTGLLRVLRGGMRHVETVAASFVIISGVYLFYYFWVVDVNESIDPITSRVENFQNWVLAQLSDNWQVAAVVLAAIVGSAMAYVGLRREPGVDAPDAPDVAPDLTGSSSSAPRP